MYFNKIQFNRLTDAQILDVINKFNETKTVTINGIKKYICIGADKFTIKYNDFSGDKTAKISDKEKIRNYIMTPQEQAEEIYKVYGVKCKYDAEGLIY